jgi:alkylation response protein AidB-like acyl-CoA dehydrogenase
MANETKLAGPAIDIVEAARNLRPLIAKLADRIEEERRLPEELLDPMHEAGMFRMFLPREAGGPELDPWTAYEVTEQLSMEDASVGWCAMIDSMSAYTAAYLPQQVARLIFDNPIGVIAGSVLGESESRVVDGGVVVTGRFHFASGCMHATWLVGVIADPRHAGEGPAPRLAVHVPATEYNIVDVWQTTGLRGTSSNDWTVEEAFVPWERTFAFLPEAGSSWAAGPIYRFPQLALPGIPHSAVQLGTVRGAMDAYRSKMEGRARHGVPFKQDPAHQAAVGRAEALIASGRAYLKEASGEFWDMVCAGKEPDLPAKARLRSAKTLADTNAVEAIDLLYEAMGSQAIMASNPLERRFRDIHATAAHFMSSRDGFRVAGAVMMGLDPRPTPLL